jgi:hypothetical protein
MGRIFFMLLTLLPALAGCYTPRSDDTPSAEPASQASSPQDTRYRARRDSAAGSGSSIEPAK